MNGNLMSSCFLKISLIIRKIKMISLKWCRFSSDGKFGSMLLKL